MEMPSSTFTSVSQYDNNPLLYNVQSGLVCLESNAFFICVTICLDKTKIVLLILDITPYIHKILYWSDKNSEFFLKLISSNIWTYHTSGFKKNIKFFISQHLRYSYISNINTHIPSIIPRSNCLHITSDLNKNTVYIAYEQVIKQKCM